MLVSLIMKLLTIEAQFSQRDGTGDGIAMLRYGNLKWDSSDGERKD